MLMSLAVIYSSSLRRI